jgi:hypothetical protein
VDPKGKVNPKGKKDAIFLGGSAREAGVIIRASVEAFGPIGDTNLTVTVNWPAGSVGATEAPDEDKERIQPRDNSKVTGATPNVNHLRPSSLLPHGEPDDKS